MLADGRRAGVAAQPGLRLGGAAACAGTRRGNRHPSIVPYETYDAADRPIAIAVGNDRLFARLCGGARARPTCAEDARFATNAARVEHRRRALPRCSAPRSRARRAAHWVAVLRAAAVPVGPINDVDEAFALAGELGMEPTEEPTGVPLVRPPLRLDGERPEIRRGPPALDEHGDEIRAWLRERCPADTTRAALEGGSCDAVIGRRPAKLERTSAELARLPLT